MRSNSHRSSGQDRYCHEKKAMKPTAPGRRLLASLIAASLVPAAAIAQHKDEVNNPVEQQKINVRDTAPWRAKLDYIMREVDGPYITVTKKTSITKVENLPTVIANNLRSLYS